MTAPTTGRWKRRLLLLSASLIVTLLLAELVARALLPNPFATEDELRGMYENAEQDGAVRTRPLWEGQHTVEGRSIPVLLNELGLRGPPLPRRTDRTERVLVLGDSFVFGYGVTQAEAFPQVLAKLVSTSLGREVVAGNAGVPGYGTVEQARCLERIRAAFEPDLVIATIYIGNDFIDDRQVSKYVQDGFSMTGEWARLMRHSARARLSLVSRAAMGLELLLMRTGSALALRPTPTEAELNALRGFPSRAGPNQCAAGLFMDHIDDQMVWGEVGGEPVIPRVLQTVRESLKSIQAGAKPAPVLVLILPTWWHVDPASRLELMKDVGLDSEHYRAGLAQERLESVCAELGLTCLDSTRAFNGRSDPLALFLPANRHLNRDGHRFIAELLTGPVTQLLQD